MMKARQIITTLGLIFVSYFSFGQCGGSPYNCALNSQGAIYLRDFNVKLRKEIPDKESGTQWAVVLNKGTHYRFNLCTFKGFENKVVMKLFDSDHPEKTNPIGESYFDGNKTNGFDYICERSGIYYVSVRFRPCEGNTRTCAVGIMSFVGKGPHYKKSTFPLCRPEILKDTNSEGKKIYRSLNGITNFDAVEILDLSKDTAANLPKEVSLLKNLKEIQLSCNQCFDLNKADSLLRRLPNLSALKIKTANYNLLTEYLNTFNHFEELDISGCYLREVPPEVFDMKNLKNLDVSRNSIENFNCPESLEEIDFSYNRLLNLPKGNPSYKIFNIANNTIHYEDIKRFIENSENLEDIKVFPNVLAEREKIGLKNKFAVISDEPVLYETDPEKAMINPERTREYRDIRIASKEPDIVYRLNLNRDKLKSQHNGLIRCTNLIILRPGYNFLKTRNILMFENLQTLSLVGNGIKKIPKEVQMLSKLRILNLSDNAVSELPKELFLLQELESLNLSKNQIQILSPNIQNFNKLRYLNLSHNNLKSLPDNIGELSNLKVLDIQYNLPEELPESIFGLKKLERIYLSANRIKKDEINKIRKKLPNCQIYCW